MNIGIFLYIIVYGYYIEKILSCQYSVTTESLLARSIFNVRLAIRIKMNLYNITSIRTKLPAEKLNLKICGGVYHSS